MDTKTMRTQARMTREADRDSKRRDDYAAKAARVAEQMKQVERLLKLHAAKAAASTSYGVNGDLAEVGVKLSEVIEFLGGAS